MLSEEFKTKTKSCGRKLCVCVLCLYISIFLFFLSLGLILCLSLSLSQYCPAVRNNAHHGEPWPSQQEGVRKYLQDFGLCFVILGGFKEAGVCFGLDVIKKHSHFFDWIFQ